MAGTLGAAPEPWAETSRGMRDAMLEHARRHCSYWAEAAPPGTPFERIPPLTRAILRERWDDLQARGVPAARRMEGATSGSTGEPAPFVTDLASIGAHAAGFAALRLLHGLPDAAPAQSVSSPRPRRPVPPGWDWFSLSDLSPAGVARLVAGWDGRPAAWLYTSASGIERMADVMLTHGMRLRRPPAAVVTSMDMLTEPGRRRVAEAFGCPVHSWYGLQEVSPYLAGTLPDGAYALNPLLAWLEIVDEEGLPVREGEVGRILLTDLHNRVCPMIRYDTQDLAVRGGRHHGAWPVLERLEGRSSELIRLPGGRFVGATTLGAHLIRGTGLEARIRLYQCLQREPNRLELRVAWVGGPRPEDEARVREALRPLLDPDTALDIVAVEDLERLPSGKRWMVRSEVAAGAGGVAEPMEPTADPHETRAGAPPRT